MANSILTDIVNTLEDKKALDICILKIDMLTTIADYFVICHGNSTTHTKALADGLEEGLMNKGINLLHKEGYDSGKWILMDYGNVVVHIFTSEQRNFYGLERIWSDAPKIEVDKIL